MAHFNEVGIVVFVWLYSSCYAKCNETAYSRENITSSQHWVTENGKHDINLKGENGGLNNMVSSATNSSTVEEVINFALRELNHASRSLYQEQVDRVIEVQNALTDGELYRIKLRLAESKCKKDNSSCDAGFHPVKHARIIAALDPPMKPGKVIQVEGRIPLRSRGFDVTIQVGYATPMQAQLRVSAKFSDNSNVILLKHFDEAWNLDVHHDGFLEPNSTFVLIITCFSTKFEVYINGKILASVNHVLPYEDASHLSISGEVDITSVSGIGPYLPFDLYKPWPAWEKDEVKYQTSVYVPFTAPLDSPLAPGKSISIKGITHPLAKLFVVYIQTGTNETVPEAVQLRFTSSFADSEKEINLDSYDGGWKYLESNKQIMTAGHSFHLVITCRTDKFEISIDGDHVATYDHRLPYENATHLRIEGRVNISEVIGIDELPPIRVFDPPRGYSVNLPLYDLPLTPGRKLKFWTYIPENATAFSFCINDGDPVKIDILKVKFNLSGNKWQYEMNTYSDYKFGAPSSSSTLDWFKAGESLQGEIEYTGPLFHVRFFNTWMFSFNATREPVSKGTTLSLWQDVLVYGISGLSLQPPSLPPSSPPPRVCELSVLVEPHPRKMWLNGLECVDSPVWSSAPSY